MLKPEDRPLFGALILLAAAVLVFALVKPLDAPPNGCDQQYANHEAFKECVEIASAQSVAVYTRLLAYFTAALAVLTLGLAGAGFWQGYLTNNSIKLARDEFNATHRPQIEIQRIYREGFDIDRQFRVSFLVANEGETNATIENINLAIEITPRLPAVRVPERWDADYQDIEIVARSGYPLSVTTRGTLTEADYVGVHAAHRYLFFLAEIEYHDSGGTRRGRSLCFRFDPSRDRFLLDSDPNYTYGA
jgi:hypothetical protein